MITQEDANRVNEKIIQLKKLKESYVAEKIKHQQRASELKDLLKGDNERRRPELAKERSEVREFLSQCEIKINQVNAKIIDDKKKEAASKIKLDL